MWAATDQLGTDRAASVYPWRGGNAGAFVMLVSDKGLLAIGGAQGAAEDGQEAIFVQGDFQSGRSAACKAFGSPMLAAAKSFNTQCLEVFQFQMAGGF